MYAKKYYHLAYKFTQFSVVPLEGRLLYAIIVPECWMLPSPLPLPKKSAPRHKRAIITRCGLFSPLRNCNRAGMSRALPFLNRLSHGRHLSMVGLSEVTGTLS